MGGNKFRISHKKASTGCGTCRARRVKCDEQKPCCRRCAIAGRICDGYRTQDPFVVFIAPQTRNQLSDGFENDTERRFFDYFRSISAFEFSRFFDEKIWCKQVLQAAHSVPAVKHAVVAVASSHESFKAVRTHVPWNLPRWPTARIHAQGEYSKAVTALRIQLEQDKSQCLPVVLTCGLLFCCLEMLGGNAPGALAHLAACIKILNSITSKPDPTAQDIIYIQSHTPLTNDVERDLLPIFTRLDIMASQGVIGRVPLLKQKTLPALDDHNASPAYSFLSFSEAVQALYSLESAELALDQTTWFDRFGLEVTHGGFSCRLVNPINTGHIPLEQLAARENILKHLSSWGPAFAAFVSRHPTEADSRGYLLLRAHHKVITMKVINSLYTEESMMDDCMPMFVELLDVCAAIFSKSTSSQSSTPNERRPPPTWSVEGGIIRSLTFLTFACRDGRIRRHALWMLERCPQEGVWVPDMEAPPLRRLIELEEGIAAGSSIGDWPPQEGQVFKRCEDIPEWKRIHFGWKVPVPGQRKSMWYCLTQPNGSDGGWHVNEDVVDWLPEKGLYDSPYMKEIGP
ncbi:uncharacterized protein BDZ99DRAFT_474047 [Mytilinidion resinicola]|uniref:Zn(2)-C6 fungal-type domain-containing protein n=1 Tax=Mytilinidion resinicola TaxID=574789 RepID=A0A6A6YX54_9PEZI|nr:uncharacterized protein BDZ99DRAFT_474047 [Mytilinidion resinicola]KAF2813381.1 hypothetical protein BDZ99DRAFT_474047 [Mytilinidion resinicola]